MGLKIVEQSHPVTTVLLVDDDLNQHAFINLALKNDYSVICESSGANAVQRALNERPHLILLDLQMPHVDGFEVLEQIKRHPQLGSIPVFCLSAATDEATRERCYNSGAASFITKPINVKTLSSDIQKTMQGLSTTLTSSDQKSSVFIGMNDDEIMKWYQHLVEIEHSRGKKILTLSVREGAFYLNETLNEYVNSNDLIFLQIKPSLITRLPFLDDLETVLTDMKKLLDDKTEAYTLVVDRPELVLLSPTNDNKTATILAFSEVMNGHFSEVHYLCRKPRNKFEEPMNEMAQLLVRQF